MRRVFRARGELVEGVVCAGIAWSGCGSKGAQSGAGGGGGGVGGSAKSGAGTGADSGEPQ